MKHHILSIASFVLVLAAPVFADPTIDDYAKWSGATAIQSLPAGIVAGQAVVGMDHNTVTRAGTPLTPGVYITSSEAVTPLGYPVKGGKMQDFGHAMPATLLVVGSEAEEYLTWVAIETSMRAPPRQTWRGGCRIRCPAHFAPLCDASIQKCLCIAYGPAEGGPTGGGGGSCEVSWDEEID